MQSYTYLGVPFSRTGTFQAAVKHFVSRAKIAMGTVWKPLIATRCNSWSTVVKLFQAIATATLLYSAGIWGLRYSAEIERIQTDFLKWILNVPRNTPGYIIRIESGRIHLEHELVKRGTNYWLKLINMGEHRYPRRCFEVLRALDRETPDLKRNWYTQMKNKLSKYGYEDRDLAALVSLQE